jgi:hypothetical protein
MHYPLTQCSYPKCTLPVHVFGALVPRNRLLSHIPLEAVSRLVSDRTLIVEQPTSSYATIFGMFTSTTWKPFSTAQSMYLLVTSVFAFRVSVHTA